MRGAPNETLLALIAHNVRLPDLVLGDLDAQYATCHIGERELLRLFERYGEASSRGYFDRAARLRRGADPQGDRRPGRTATTTSPTTSTATASRPTPIPICCAVTVEGDHLCVDFAGSSPQVKGAINSTFSFVKSSTYLTIRCALDHDVPNNAGVYRCITVTAPEGSILNPRHAGAGRGARADRLPRRRHGDGRAGADRAGPLMAAGEGGNTVVAIGGYDRQTGEPFVLVDMINGAWGGRADKDGIEGVTNPAQNMSNLPIETLEARYPLRMEEYALRPDSGGAGQFPRRPRAGAALPPAGRRQRCCSCAPTARASALWPVRRPAGGLSRNLLNPDGENAPASRQGDAGGRQGHRAPPRAGRRRRLGRSARAGPRRHRQRPRRGKDLAAIRGPISRGLLCGRRLHRPCGDRSGTRAA